MGARLSATGSKKAPNADVSFICPGQHTPVEVGSLAHPSWHHTGSKDSQATAARARVWVPRVGSGARSAVGLRLPGEVAIRPVSDRRHHKGARSRERSQPMRAEPERDHHGDEHDAEQRERVGSVQQGLQGWLCRRAR